MDDLAAFLNARLDEDESRWRDLADLGEQGYWDFMLAEVDAKRRIIAKLEHYRQRADEPCTREEGIMYDDHVDALTAVVQLLALPYANHPDYRPEWRPNE